MIGTKEMSLIKNIIANLENNTGKHPLNIPTFILDML